MANDLQDLLGNSNILLTKPNRLYDVNRDFEHHVQIYQYNEGVMRIHDISDHVTHKYKGIWTNINKSEEWDILQFFTGRKGRLRNFWLPLWQNEFKLYQDISIWDDTIVIHDCFATDTFQGYERIFFELSNGDIITRHVTAVTDNGDDTETLTIETMMTRAIATTDIVYFGRLILTRFDQDELLFDHYTPGVSDVDLSASFLEVTEEYAAAGAES